MRATAGISIAAVALAVIALDQATKAWVIRAIGPDQADHRRDVLGSWLSLEYVQNRGAAFGLFGGGGPLVIALAAVGFVVFVYAMRRISRPSRGFLLGAGLVAGGAIGNVIDRARLGYVIDFIAVSVWWRFNLADSAVTVGVVIFMWLSMQSRIERENG